MRGRPMKNRSNNWNPDWYPVLDCGARRILYGTVAQKKRLVEREELISEMWLACMRLLPSSAKKGDWRWAYLRDAAYRCINRAAEKSFLAGVTLQPLPDGYECPEIRQDLRVEDVEEIMHPLTEKQREVVIGLLQGKSHREIAKEMKVTHQCVTYQVKKIREQLKCAS